MAYASFQSSPRSLTSAARSFSAASASPPRNVMSSWNVSNHFGRQSTIFIHRAWVNIDKWTHLACTFASSPVRTFIPGQSERLAALAPPSGRLDFTQLFTC
jgi:hypothetical protein